MNIETNAGVKFTQPPPIDAAEPLPCPLCEYDLRGQQEPRCPECGYRFEWAEVLDPSRRRHPYLFEHHPRRNFWSFFRTLIGGLRPSRFWSSLHPAQPSRPGRLLLYAALTTLINLAAIAVSAAVYIDAAFRSYWSQSAFSGSLASFLERLWTAYRWDDTLKLTVFAVLLALVGPAVAFLAMLVFAASMRRAKVKRIHVLRGVVYAFDALVWLALVGVAWTGVTSFVRPPAEIEAILVVAVWSICWAVVLRRLTFVYSRYLRFDHPYATAFAVMVIFTLAMFKVLFIAMQGSF